MHRCRRRCRRRVTMHVKVSVAVLSLCCSAVLLCFAARLASLGGMTCNA